ncbi:MAG: hypothetical protein ACOCR0_01305 [Haloferacaceae archaeon]
MTDEPHLEDGYSGDGEHFDGSVEDASIPDHVHVEDLHEGLDALAAQATSPETEWEIDRTKRLLDEAAARGLIESSVRPLRSRDAAEALVGSIVFASPLLVEGGIFDIAEFLATPTVGAIPLFLLANTAFVVLMTTALVQWTGRDRDETTYLLGIVPARVVMVLVVALCTSTLLMTVWGRVNWAEPAAALARVSVLWSVGALGAALGDILSEHPPPTAVETDDSVPEGVLLERIADQFHELETAIEREFEVEQLHAWTHEATLDGAFGDRIRKYTGRDVVEAFVGTVFFSIPLLVEDGVFDVADFFLGVRLLGFPVFFLANTAFVLLMIYALLYWAGPQDVRIYRPILGIVPRRLVGVSVVSFLTAALLMTMWGRVDGWQDPVVAIARISAVWSVGSFGATLGDILPGESSGNDINETIGDFGEQVGGIVEQFEQS